MADDDDLLARSSALLAAMRDQAAAPERDWAAASSARRSSARVARSPADSRFGGREDAPAWPAGAVEAAGKDLVRAREELLAGNGELLSGDERAAFHLTGHYEPHEMLPVLAVNVNRATDRARDQRDNVDEHKAMAASIGINASEGPEQQTLGATSNLLVITEILAKRLSELQRAATDNAVRQTYTASRSIEREMHFNLQEEIDTWILLYMLHTSRLDPFEIDEEPQVPQHAVDASFYADSELQVWAVVTRWLQRTSASGPRPSAKGDNARMGRYWPKTILSAERSMLQRADVDGLLRETVDPDDLDDQLQLLRELWKLVRGGAFFHTITTSDSTDEPDSLEAEISSEEAELMAMVVDVCNRYGEPWRIASLMGGRPGHIPDKYKWTGNANRAIWKDMCSKLADSAANSAVTLLESGESSRAVTVKSEGARLECAIYATLAGDYDLLRSLPVCADWRDQCWALFRNMVDSRIDWFCITNRSRLESEFGHTPGPMRPNGTDLSQVEKRLFDKAERFAIDTHSAFDQVAPTGPAVFFRIQRALVEGKFWQLLVPGETPADNKGSLCAFLCGEEWSTLAESTIREVCNPTTAQPTVAPVWAQHNEHTAAQLLRFVAHLSIYIANAETARSLVEEDTDFNPAVIEAIVLAYIRFLLEDDSSSVCDRFKTIPNLYSSLQPLPRSNGHGQGKEVVELAQVIQAALMESTAVATDEKRYELWEDWHQYIAVPTLIPRAARLAVRNVRHQWLHDVQPTSLVATALNTIAYQERTAEPQSDGSQELFDIRHRLIATWRWLNMIDGCHLEAMTQANAILRDLIKEGLTSDADSSSFPIAKEFILEVGRSSRDLVAEAREGTGPAQWHMSPQTIEQVTRERDHWRDFLEVHDRGIMWGAYMARLESRFQGASERNHIPEEIVEALYAGAEDIANGIEIVLTRPGGWMVDTEANRASELETQHDPTFEDDLATTAELQARMEQIHNPGDLRSMCVVAMVNQYVQVLESAASWLRANSSQDHHRVVTLCQRLLSVTTCIADPSHLLLECFSPEETQALLEHVRLASIQIIELGGSISP